MIKRNALTLLGGLLVLLHPAAGTILLNEIHINPPPDLDLNYEYIELVSTTGGVESCAGLTLLVIDNNGGTVGEVKEAFDLSPFSTGTNGLLLLGNGYDGSPAGGPWSGYKAGTTTTGDPSKTADIYSGMGDDDLDPNGGLTFLLVKGWTGLTNATVDSLGSVDVNNNSVLDWAEATKPAGSQQTQPYTEVVDSIGYRDLGNNPVRLPYTNADLNLRTGNAPSYAPDNISRRLGRDQPNNTAAWYGGNLTVTTPNSITYDNVQFFGDFKGQATPGQPNLGAAPVPGNFLINEVSINPASIEAGNDSNFEFIEIINTANNNGTFAASLQGYALLLIGSSQGSGNVGRIIEAWDLSSMSTGANGLLLLGDGYPEGRAPWGEYIDSLTQLGEPEAPAVQNPVRYSSMGEDDIGSNNGFTLLLVRGYTGTMNQVVGNASGSFTVQPWTSLVDSVGFDEVDLSGGLTAGKSYATGKVSATYTAGGAAKNFPPEHVARKAGNTTANAAAAWYGGQFAARNPYSIGLRNGFYFGGFRGESTPGRPNLSAAPATGAVLLNEVHVNPPTTTDSTEFIEVINPAGGIVGMHDLWALVIGSNGANRGVILKTLDLRGMSTGPNGLAIFADGIEEQITPWLPFVSPQTLREDPASYNDDGSENSGSNFGQNFIEPNNGTSVLLVKGFTGSQNQDLDTNDDGTLDTKPWSELVDSVSFGEVIDPSIPQLSFNGYTPGNLSRLPGNTAANAAAAWHGGELEGDQPTSTDYTSNYTGSFKGAASPGRLNHTATPDASASVLLNEININPPGSDGNYEFIELISSNRQSLSTNGYTLLLVDVSGAGVGAVQEAWSLDGLSTGPNGLLLTGSGYNTPALPWTGANAPAEGTRLGAPLGMGPDDIGGATNNGALTVLLVKDFTGRVGDDLDIFDSGTLSTPYKWGALTDSAGLRKWDTDLVPPAFSGIVYGPTSGKVDLSKSGYTPDNLSRYYDNLSPNTLAAWYGGDISGSGGTSTIYDAAQRFPLGEFVGSVTPGKPNLTPNEIIDDLGDSDKDGVANIIEIALGMDMAKSDAHLLPAYTTVTVAGTTYSAITFDRPSGGTATGSNKYTINGVLCTVQFSTDLVTWTDGVQLYGTLDAGGEPPKETATYRANTASHTAGQAAGQSFLRLKVERP